MWSSRQKVAEIPENQEIVRQILKNVDTIRSDSTKPGLESETESTSSIGNVKPEAYPYNRPDENASELSSAEGLVMSPKNQGAQK